MDTTLDPLRNSELHRALAFARARETYPGIGGELLLELCDAAWERSAGDTRDGGALERFERALDVVARSYRVGGGRLTVSEVAADAIPLAALQPYIDAQKRRPAPVEPEPAPARRTLADRLPSLPRIAPAPVGVSLAAGVFGITAAAQAGVLEQTPLAPLSFTDRSDAPAPAGQAARGSGPRADSGAAQGASGSGSASSGAGFGAGSSWVGELAAQHAAGTTEPGPAPASEPATVQGPAVSPGLADSTGGTPAAPAPAAPVQVSPPAAPAPAPRWPAIEVPAIEVDLAEEDTDEGSQAPTGEQEEQQPPVGVHFPNIQLPGGVVIEIPQGGPPEHEGDETGQDQPGAGQDQPDEGEAVPPEQVLTPGEDAGRHEEFDDQPSEDDEPGTPDDEAEQPLPPEGLPDGVAERVPAEGPVPEAQPAPPAAAATPPAPATPPATAQPAAAAPAPAPAPEAPPAPAPAPGAPAQAAAPAPAAPPPA